MEKLFYWAVNHEKISVLCCPSFKFVKTLRGLDMEIDNINYLGGIKGGFWVKCGKRFAKYDAEMRKSFSEGF